MRYLLLLFLAACSSTPTTYERGAYPVRPPPPAARPGVGAPVVGQPGYGTRSVPRIRGRLLPQTPETRRQPGLWSAEEPRAMAGDDDELPDDPILLGVRLPFPESAKDDAAKKPTRACAFYMELAIEHRRELGAARRLTDAQRGCLAAQLYLVCASGEERRDEATHHAKGPAHSRIVRAVSGAAESFTAKMCRGGQPDDEVRRIIGKVVPLWNQFADVPEAQ